ncbi:MAG: CRTAC1 family protein [Verrucomicrobia bacterium]|nr:CRTAC1 family protein [Verrucomicrobiota bacterium]
MKRLLSSATIVLALGLVLNAFSQAAGAPAAVPDKTNIVHHPPFQDIPKMLADRGRQQIEAAKRFGAFQDFRFTDRAAESKITFEQSSVEDSLKWWKGVHYDHGSGVAVADVDGDGRLDICFVNQLGPNQLWRNLGKGQFEDITARAGVAQEGRIHVAASFADIDNDGDPDLFVTTVRGGNVLFENLGGGRFRDIAEPAGLGYVGHSSGSVFFDFDRDGLLDLFLTNVGVYTTDQKKRGGFYASVTNAFGGHMYPERTEFSLLYRNLGNRKFRDVSGEIGLRDGSWSGDASFTDLNGDGFSDLYVLNMQGDNHFYENVAGKRFADKTASHFPKTPWGAMGIKFFDFNRDGLFDLFITDMHSDMAETQSREGRTNMRSTFEKAKSDPWCTTYFDAAFLQGASNNVFGNALYLNKGGGAFEEVSGKVGAETYWPWGLSVGDLNADGYEDAFITAGMGYPFRYGINSVLLNERGRQFFDAEFVVGVEPRTGGRFDKPMFSLDVATEDAAHELALLYGPKVLVYGALSSRSSAIFDLDDDGDLDIVTNEMNDRPMVLVSNLSERRPIHFLKMKLIGTVSNRDGLGATVKVKAGETTLTQFNDGKSGYLAQSVIPLYFGLGEIEAASSVEIRWPSGRTQIISDAIPRNGLLTVREPRE